MTEHAENCGSRKVMYGQHRNYNCDCGAEPNSKEDAGCICKGNWREIVKETEPLFEKTFSDKENKLYRLFGVVHAEDDYYYGLISTKGDFVLASCVGSLETNGFTLVKGARKLPTQEELLLKKIFGEE